MDAAIYWCGVALIAAVGLLAAAALLACLGLGALVILADLRAWRQRRRRRR